MMKHIDEVISEVGRLTAALMEQELVESFQMETSDSQVLGVMNNAPWYDSCEKQFFTIEGTAGYSQEWKELFTLLNGYDKNAARGFSPDIHKLWDYCYHVPTQEGTFRFFIQMWE